MTEPDRDFLDNYLRKARGAPARILSEEDERRFRDAAQTVEGEDAVESILSLYRFDTSDDRARAGECIGIALLRHVPKPVAEVEGLIERAWNEVRETLNSQHLEGIISYRELKAGVNSAAIIRDAADARVAELTAVLDYLTGRAEQALEHMEDEDGTGIVPELIVRLVREGVTEARAALHPPGDHGGRGE